MNHRDLMQSGDRFADVAEDLQHLALLEAAGVGAVVGGRGILQFLSFIMLNTELLQ